MQDEGISVRLQQARRAARVTQEQLAAAMDMSRTTITAIEKGERKVTARELDAIARYLGVDLGAILSPSPLLPNLSVQLRSVARGRSGDAPELDAVVVQLQRLVEDYLELERIRDATLATRYPAERQLGSLSPEEAAELIADQERARLNIGDAPIQFIDQMLEREIGIRVFGISMPSEVSGMFVHDRVAGSCVAFNSKHRVERIRNTLAHEYAHFLTARTAGAVDFGGQYVRQPALERFANAFAIAFLLPRQGLIRHSAQLRSSAEGRLKVEDVVVLASYYGVSLESMFLRLEDLKLIRRGSWLRLKGEGFSPSDAKQELGIGDSVAAVPLLPRRYVVLAVEAYRSGELSEGQLARFLRSDIVGARDAVRSVGSQDDSVLEGALDSDMQSHRSGENLL